MKNVVVSVFVLAMSCAAFGQVWEIPQGSPTIDADLSDWAGVTWIAMDVNAYGDPANISNAKMAVQWDATNIYMAVTYDDTDLQLATECLAWDGQDDIEVYINANNDNVDGYAGSWTSSQQYFVGPNGDNPGGLSSTPAPGSWYNLGSQYALPDPVNWPHAVIDVATDVTGNSFTYEMRLPTLNNITTGSLQTLSVGDVVGVDVYAADKGAANYGWKGFNDVMGKYTNASVLQDWTLVPEPCTMIMLGLGGVALLRRKRA